ncbi:hypothetical protein E2P81_ATG12026 [Venturia nashicola]|nr:hypothetical protein E2P81_ATG12026 [Venturia nashicola]
MKLFLSLTFFAFAIAVPTEPGCTNPIPATSTPAPCNSDTGKTAKKKNETLQAVSTSLNSTPDLRLPGDSRITFPTM